MEIEYEKKDNINFEIYNNSIAKRELYKMCINIKKFLNIWNKKFYQINTIVINRPMNQTLKQCCDIRNLFERRNKFF